MRLLLYMICVFGILSFWSSCKHDPIIMDDDMMPIDTTGTNPVDTISSDTTVIDTTDMGIPCDTNLVYFNMDVLPLLRSNCAFSGCHDAASAEDGVILESYESVMQTADVEAFNLDDSELYEVLVDDDEDERMPPPPTDRLNAAQIQLIAKWILQGAQNLECDPDFNACDTLAVSFSSFVKPTIELHCQGCHSGNTPAGGIDLTTYENIKTIALDNNRLYGSIAWQDEFKNMPQGGEQLADCTIAKIKSWINDGALDN